MQGQKREKYNKVSEKRKEANDWTKNTEEALTMVGNSRRNGEKREKVPEQRLKGTKRLSPPK